MDVKLIAHTAITDDGYALTDSWDWVQERVVPDDNDRVVEIGGRACYQSWDHPNPKTAANRDYVAHILDVDHASVLEHSVATFYITGVSRSLTHELIRHRHLSPSQQSQRYVDEASSTFIDPPLFDQLRERLLPKWQNETSTDEEDSVLAAIDAIHDVAEHARVVYEEFVTAAAALKIKRKQAREAARSILPNGTETRIVMTGNLRAWRHFIHMRYSVHADAEIMELARRILGLLREVAPNCVQDIPNEPRK